MIFVYKCLVTCDLLGVTEHHCCKGDWQQDSASCCICLFYRLWFHERIEKIVLGRRYTLSPDVLHKLALYCLFKNNLQKISNKRLSLTSCAINYMSEFVTWSKMSSTQCSPLQTLAIQLCPVAGVLSTLKGFWGTNIAPSDWRASRVTKGSWYAVIMAPPLTT